MRTIGGGMILESNPPKHKRFRQEIIEGLLVKEGGSPQQLLEQILRETKRYPLTEKELIKRSGLTKGESANALEKLMIKGKIKALELDTSRLFILNEYYEDISEKIMDILKQFHTINPLKAGISQSELANKVSLDLRIFGRILSQMEEEGKIKQEGNLARLSEHKIRLSPAQEQLQKEIEGRFLTDKFSPPSIEDIKDELNFGEEEIEEIVELLSERKILVKVSSEVSFHREAIEEAKDLLLKEISSRGEISLGEFRDILKTSRKYALPLLEYFDELSLTRRVGNKRVLR